MVGRIVFYLSMAAASVALFYIAVEVLGGL
jgi:hypothetical protein